MLVPKVNSCLTIDKEIPDEPLLGFQHSFDFLLIETQDVATLRIEIRQEEIKEKNNIPDLNY
jgi:hypothetical protein